jgi:hypothetical protein
MKYKHKIGYALLIDAVRNTHEYEFLGVINNLSILEGRFKGVDSFIQKLLLHLIFLAS